MYFHLNLHFPSNGLKMELNYSDRARENEMISRGRAWIAVFLFMWALKATRRVLIFWGTTQHITPNPSEKYLCVSVESV